MDSNFRDAIPLMQTHTKLCEDLFMADWPEKAEPSVVKVPLLGISEETYLGALSQANPSIDTTALAAPPMDTHQAHFEAQVKKAQALTDFNIFDVSGELVWGLSPRSVELRMQCAYDCDESDGARTDGHDKHRVIDDCKEPEGAKWCENCGKWLNGPKQY